MTARPARARPARPDPPHVLSRASRALSRSRWRRQTQKESARPLLHARACHLRPPTSASRAAQVINAAHLHDTFPAVNRLLASSVYAAWQTRERERAAGAQKKSNRRL